MRGTFARFASFNPIQITTATCPPGPARRYWFVVRFQLKLRNENVAEAFKHLRGECS